MNEPTDRPWLERNRRPEGVSDETVAAVGKFGEALEWVERARGHLYDFHQMMGHADALIGEAADELREAGHSAQARHIEADLVGRNAIEGRWSFQLVEEYDAIYWSAVRAAADDLPRTARRRAPPRPRIRDEGATPNPRRSLPRAAPRRRSRLKARPAVICSSC
ncbi:MAG: hypothetical protein V9F00_19020 [Nocardioides sp.]